MAVGWICGGDEDDKVWLVFSYPVLLLLLLLLVADTHL
jgi:hypothetical protein